MQGLSFADAQARVRAVVADPWEAEGWGEFYIAPYGAENATHWCVIFGAREWIVDHDVMFMLVGTPITLVSKTTGEISELSYIANFDLVDSMTDVGDWPPDDDDDRPAGLRPTSCAEELSKPSELVTRSPGSDRSV